MNLPHVLTWLTLAALAAGCSSAPRKPKPTPAQLQALEAARQAEQKALQAQQQAREAAERKRQAEEAARRVQERQARLAVELAGLVTPVTAELATLRRWDQHGDTPVEQLATLQAFVPALDKLRPLQEACQARLLELAEVPGAMGAEARQACGPATRARAIVARQFVASAKRSHGFLAVMGEVAARYHRTGKVGWTELLELEAVVEEVQRRSAELQPLAALLGLGVPAEIFQAGLKAREALAEALERGARRLSLPTGVDDRAFAALVAPLVAQAPDGPLAGLRGPVLQVRALDAAWQPQVDARGRLVRRTREGVVLVRGPQATCWALWLRIDQPARGPAVLRWSDDVRRLACPDARVPEPPAVAQSSWVAGSPERSCRLHRKRAQADVVRP